jgi:hypothetical protein
MDADRDIEIVIVDGPGQVQAFADKKANGLFAHTPYLETAIVNYQAVLVADTSGGEVPALTDGQIHALATTRENANTKQETTAAVTRAIYRAQKRIHSDRKATVDAIIASGATTGSRALIEAIASIYSSAVPQTPKISLTGISSARQSCTPLILSHRISSASRLRITSLLNLPRKQSKRDRDGSSVMEYAVLIQTGELPEDIAAGSAEDRGRVIAAA